MELKVPPSKGPGEEPKCGNWLSRLLTGLAVLFWWCSSEAASESGSESADWGRGDWAVELCMWWSLGSVVLSDCIEREAADGGGDGERSIGNELMELLERLPLIAGGLFIMVVAVDDEDGDANNDVVVVADLACRRDAVKHRFRYGLIN